MSHDSCCETSALESLRRQIRLLQILNAAEEAGLNPLPIIHLHTLAFLSNILSPVWSSTPLDGKVLKRQGGPFYPKLQADMDRLVGQGVAIISDMSHTQNEEGKWQLEGAYHLNREFADKILQEVLKFPDELEVVKFIEELAIAFSMLSDDEICLSMSEDATYGDKNIDIDNVIDFDEWKKENFSVNAATEFEKIANEQSVKLLPSEKIHLYIHHLSRRISANG